MNAFNDMVSRDKVNDLSVNGNPIDGGKSLEQYHAIDKIKCNKNRDTPKDKRFLTVAHNPNKNPVGHLNNSLNKNYVRNVQPMSFFVLSDREYANTACIIRDNSGTKSRKIPNFSHVLS